MARIPAPVNLNSGCISSSLTKQWTFITVVIRLVDWWNLQLLSIYTGSSSASSCRITCLHHEILILGLVNREPWKAPNCESGTHGDDTVEENTIVIASFCKFREVLACLITYELSKSFSKTSWTTKSRTQLTLGAWSQYSSNWMSPKLVSRTTDSMFVCVKDGTEGRLNRVTGSNVEVDERNLWNIEFNCSALHRVFLPTTILPQLLYSSSTHTLNSLHSISVGAPSATFNRRESSLFCSFEKAWPTSIYSDASSASTSGISLCDW